MYGKLAHKNYTAVQISTVDRGRLLLMMYEGALKFLNHAKEGLLARDIPKFARFLSKSQAIIAELMHTLDFEKGGQIAKDLDRLYDFMLYYLTEANLQKDPAKIQRVINLMEIIAGAYREILDDKEGKYRDVQQMLAAEAAAASAGTSAASAPAATPAPKPVESGKRAEPAQALPGSTIRVAF
ncbi:MAG: flagellar export chaperone FliS [Deltaproteobacteria bacterium]|nr:flagellar export chaperone FliS [Deltaproteobacteria bacterium]